MTRLVVLAGAMAGLLFTTAAHAEPVVYSWTGYGVNVPDGSKFRPTRWPSPSRSMAIR